MSINDNKINWDYHCPQCNGISETHNHFTTAKAEGHCKICNIDFRNVLDRNIEVTFTPAEKYITIPMDNIKGKMNEMMELIKNMEYKLPDPYRLAMRTEELAASAGDVGDTEIKATVVSDRPTGSIGADHPLVTGATQILNDLGVPVKDIRYRIGSTDANVPLSRGIPAVAIYLTDGHDIHRTSEWLSLESLPIGMTLASSLRAILLPDSIFHLHGHAAAL